MGRNWRLFSACLLLHLVLFLEHESQLNPLGLLIKSVKRFHKELIILGIIILLALCVRVWGISYDLPYIYHPDEPDMVRIIQNMFKTGDPNPHFFSYPSLFIYVNALAYVPYFIFGKIIGIFATRNDIFAPITLVMGVTKTQLSSSILLGRFISVILGVGTVGLTFAAGRKLSGKLIVGVLAALMVAISPTNVWHSRFITPDTLVVFFVVASFVAIVFVYQQGKTRHYIIAGICIGLTAASKYNGGLIVLSLLLAHFFRYGRTALKERNLYLSLVMCGVGFLVATPYALLDYKNFFNAVISAGSVYSSSHAGMEGNTLQWYIEYLWSTGSIILILGVLEIFRGIYTRSKEIILLSLFPVLYFLFISSFFIRNDRTILPLTPFLILLAASFLGFLLEKARELLSKEWRRVSIAAVACFSMVTFIQPASVTISQTKQLTTVNSRETARIWIQNNLPPGSKIAIEAYTPFIDPTRFAVYGFFKMIEHKPEWYIEQGFDYLIFGQNMYGRFYLDPKRYSVEISQYDDLFERFQLVKMFTDGGYEVRIYKVK